MSPGIQRTCRECGAVVYEEQAVAGYGSVTCRDCAQAKAAAMQPEHRAPHCEAHLAYTGQRRPENLCPECWTLYARERPASVAGQYARELGPSGPLGHGLRQLTPEMCALLLVLGQRLDGVEGANGEGRD